MLAYLYSRYPVVSQTFCDSEMLALEALGHRLVVGSLYPPKDSFRHERLAGLRAAIHYPPPPAVLKALQARAKADGTWPEEMIARHDRDYGPAFQSAVRARNALWFARLFQRAGVRHIHVHFANRATHTALFIKAIAGIPFSFTPHAQDFMVDLGSDALLDEMCREASMVVAVSDFSLGLLRGKCPGGAAKMRRVYNGLDVDAFPVTAPAARPAPRIVSTGRLIEFKGFHHLLGALARMRDAGVPATLRLIGDGPCKQDLQNLAARLGIAGQVDFLGARSQQEVMAELAAADVFALACTVDAKGASDILPTVIAEAMACGLPVVSTRLAGVPEMVLDGETGLLAEPGDEAGLAAHLLALHADRDMAHRLGSAGRARAGEVFSLAVTARQFSDALAAAGGPVPSPVDHEPCRAWLVPAWPVPADLRTEIAWARDTFPNLPVLAMRADPDAATPPDAADYLPDGIVLEAAWCAHSDHAARCEALRQDLGPAVDGEWFFHLARRAVWLAEEAPKRGWLALHGARSDEAVLAWLVHELSGLPFSAVLEPDHTLDGKLAARLQSTANPWVDSRREDRLLLRPPPPKRRKLGPLRWDHPAPPDDPAARRRLLDQLFRPNA